MRNKNFLQLDLTNYLSNILISKERERERKKEKENNPYVQFGNRYI